MEVDPPTGDFVAQDEGERLTVAARHGEELGEGAALLVLPRPAAAGRLAAGGPEAVRVVLLPAALSLGGGAALSLGPGGISRRAAGVVRPLCHGRF